MKTFKDLVFHSHPTGPGLAAKLFFENGYGVSVVRFKMPLSGLTGLPYRDDYGSYTKDETEWEVAVLRGTAQHWDIAYDTPITDDVIGNCKEEDVTAIMHDIQKFKKDEPIQSRETPQSI